MEQQTSTMQDDVLSITGDAQWHCRSCTNVFQIRGKRDSHHRKTHQQRSGRKEIIGLNRQLQRSNTETFECLCGKKYMMVQGLFRHQRTCKVRLDVLKAERIQHDTEQGLSVELILLTVETEQEANSEGMRLEVEDTVGDLIIIDNYYNLAVCRECGVRISFE